MSRTQVLEKAPRGVTGRVSSRCGVIGRGSVAARTAHALLVAGADVVLVAPDHGAAAQVRALVEGAVQVSVRQGEIEYLRKGMSRLHTTTRVADLAGVEVTVQVPERDGGSAQVIVAPGTAPQLASSCLEVLDQVFSAPVAVRHEGEGS